MTNDRGFTLIELIIVMVIMGVLLTLAAISFSNWNRKSQIERQTREMFADINLARNESVFKKSRHAMIFQPNSYIMKRYSSPDESRFGDTTKGIVLTRNLVFGITKANNNSMADIIIEFDVRGFTNDLETIRVNPTNSGAQFDCMAISGGRINLGKMEGTSCVQK